MSDTPSHEQPGTARPGSVHRPGAPDQPDAAAVTSRGTDPAGPVGTTDGIARTPRGGGRRPVLLSAGLDVAAVLVFVLVGRRSHAEGTTVAGVLDTAWPFLVALVFAWAIGRAWSAPMAVRTGVLVWVGTTALGLVTRVSDRGPGPLSFMVVTAVVLGVLLVGWRGVAATLQRRSASRQ